ncbi:MAG: hypothetical protein JZU65_00575 [Chlorobium sp.]|jgi:hypothetical protein|nr:hypothetical protein [Chlorobium sp.]
MPKTEKTPVKERIKNIKDYMRHPVFKLCGLLFFVVSLSGCFDVSTIITVRPDGTGTVAERMLMSNASLGQMVELVEKDQKKRSGDMPDKSELKKRAHEMGEGVRFLSIHPVATKSHKGYEALYAFNNIDQLLINRNPNKGTARDSSIGSDGQKKKNQYVRFALEKGTPSRLMVMQDQEQSSSSTGSSSAAATSVTPEQREMMTRFMQEVFRGMHVFLAVDIDGTLLGTNATHRTDKRVTLVDVDFDKLMENASQFALLTELGPEPNPEVLQKLLEKIPGVKVESKTKIDITFQ